MTLDETKRLLAVIVAHDRRTLGEVDVALWHSVLQDCTFGDCVHAVGAHIREMPGVWLDPGHVYSRVKGWQRADIERRHAGELHAESIKPIDRAASHHAFDAALRTFQVAIARKHDDEGS
jgi:hypothetical protein